MIAERIEVAPGERILVLGSGDGALARELASRASEGLAVGVDESGDQVRLARGFAAAIDNLMFVVGTPAEIPWRENFFTLVVSEHAAAAWVQPEQAARELWRVTSPGGRVCLQAPAAWQQLLADAGFAPVTARTIDGPLLLIEARKPEPAGSR